MKMRNLFKNKVLKEFKKLGFEIRRYRPLRPSMEFVKKSFKNKQLVGVELGVYSGDNAFLILKYMNIKKLYLVDPYKVYEGYDEGGREEYNKESLNRAREIAKGKLNRFLGKIVWINDFSDSLLGKIPNGLDFVYVDANHSYEYTLKDIENYYNKLRVGGILAGHDVDRVEVLKAVINFVKYKDELGVYVGGSDWWFTKKLNYKLSFNKQGFK